jgi:protein-S-isoprenylcysteine O-methyltransferase Ste14
MWFPMNIGEIQVARKFALGIAIALGILVFAVTNSQYPSGGRMHELIEWVGIVLIVFCILGRTWASLYIGGRKIDQLVTVGPYSITRNPLYFFSMVGAAGCGAQLGSITVGLIWGILTWICFHVVARMEERLLAERFGQTFIDYTRSVPRFVPNPRLWRDEATLTVKPPRVLQTFADASVFLLAIPLAEGFEWLQDLGILPVLLKLP